MAEERWDLWPYCSKSTALTPKGRGEGRACCSALCWVALRTSRPQFRSSRSGHPTLAHSSAWISPVSPYCFEAGLSPYGPASQTYSGYPPATPPPVTHSKRDRDRGWVGGCYPAPFTEQKAEALCGLIRRGERRELSHIRSTVLLGPGPHRQVAGGSILSTLPSKPPPVRRPRTIPTTPLALPDGLRATTPTDDPRRLTVIL